MRSRIALTIATFAAIAIASVAWAPRAEAGIIVTVGKPAPEDARRTKPGSLPGYTGDKATSPSTTSTPTTRTTDAKSGAQNCAQRIDPITGLPADWNCVPIGGGLLYCEDPAAAGAAPGEGGAGYYDPSEYEDEGLDEGDSMEAFGCAGGGGAASGGIFGILGVVGGIVFMIRARRR